MLRRAWSQFQLRRRRGGYHSRFGGLWTDRLDAARRLEERRAAGALGDAQVETLANWMRDGVWILPGAVAPETIERLNQDIEELWRGREPLARVELDGRYLALAPELRREHAKLVDLYARSRAALEIALAEPIRNFLGLVFEHEPLLFQSLSFERGSEQPIHQDTAYVVVTPPLAMVAAWVALEDVREGSGELAYYPGSHRLREYTFHGVRNWNRERDGIDAQRRYQEWLPNELDAQGFVRRHFRPRRGDVLFWNADLAHGGERIRVPAFTRKSLVCHYCPIDAQPYYFSYRPERRQRVAHVGSWYASAQYDLRQLPGA